MLINFFSRGYYIRQEAVTSTVIRFLKTKTFAGIEKQVKPSQYFIAQIISVP